MGGDGVKRGAGIKFWLFALIVLIGAVVAVLLSGCASPGRSPSPWEYAQEQEGSTSFLGTKYADRRVPGGIKWGTSIAATGPRLIFRETYDY